jgi:hypothetical protein
MTNIKINIMREKILIILLCSVLFTGFTIKENDQALDVLILWNAEHIDCDVYKIFYEEDFKLKTKKGKLIELDKLGFDIREIVIISNKKK